PPVPRCPRSTPQTSPDDPRPPRSGDEEAWVSAELWSDDGRDFPPSSLRPDARPRGTGRSRRGRRVTADAVDRPFAHATGDDRDQAGRGRDPRGDSGATCKTAGIASSSIRATRTCSLPARRRSLLDLVTRIDAAATSLAPSASSASASSLTTLP